ncbi:hypothetical protein FF098_005645 [Parvularcula flava]|uniref:Uncharacterized protein n=1 Tax=Aquisalinus luteolus TaxID=1566827 RepID=A0A8J3A1D2_9PROT|nr:hypothetical protein [Aquisalinus luteolus]NHK27382.1 hypothetical protein [Aquisalinus luteolus]GGH95267.1 hypothetical protein GCM10011355_11400 [Aquisalinus luteolus]
MKKHAFIFTGFSKKVLSHNAEKVVALLKEHGFTVDVFSGSRLNMLVNSSLEFPEEGSLRKHVEAETGRNDYTIAIGASGGGYGGLMHSIYAGASCFIGFSSFTNVSLASREIDPRGAQILGVMDEVILDDSRRDLGVHMDEQKPKLNVHLYYPKGEPSDTYQAENLKRFENVKLHPQDSSKHNMTDISFDVIPAILSILQAEGVAEERKLVPSE